MEQNRITLFGDSNFFGQMGGPLKVEVLANTDAGEQFTGWFSSASMMAGTIQEDSIVHSGQCVADVGMGQSVTSMNVTVTLNPGQSGESSATMVLGWNSALETQVVSLFAMAGNFTALISSPSVTTTPITLAGANAVSFASS